MIGKFLASGTHPLSAEKLFDIGPLPITNAMLFGVITGAALVSMLLYAVRYTSIHPKSKFAYSVELLVDFIWGVAIGAFGDRKKALKHLPLLATLFLFIMLSNLSGAGLLPGIGTFTYNNGEHTSALLRPFTTDLNATLAMAILSIGLVQFYAIRELKLKGHLKNYFASPLYNPMNLFVGFIEVAGEFLRIVTLSMRLFGVIYAGEVLISSVSELAGNFGWLSTVPTVLLEIFFSLIQAYVFMMLTATYLSVATSGGHDDHKAKAVS